jgi:hypothetical protein
VPNRPLILAAKDVTRDIRNQTRTLG